MDILTEYRKLFGFPVKSVSDNTDTAIMWFPNYSAHMLEPKEPKPEKVMVPSIDYSSNWMIH